MVGSSRQRIIQIATRQPAPRVKPIKHYGTRAKREPTMKLASTMTFLTTVVLAGAKPATPTRRATRGPTTSGKRLSMLAPSALITCGVLHLARPSLMRVSRTETGIGSCGSALAVTDLPAQLPLVATSSASIRRRPSGEAKLADVCASHFSHATHKDGTGPDNRRALLRHRRALSH